MSFRIKSSVFACTLAAFAAVASGVQAADIAPEPGPESVLYDWSGVYIGAGLGYLGGKSKNSFTDNTGALGGATTKPDGGMIGGYAGYNWQMPDSPLVLGIEGDFYGVNAKDSSVLNATTNVRQNIKSTWAVKGRAGWALGNFMPYISGGYTGASVKSSVNGPLQTNVVSDTSTLHGWTVGAGVEMMVTPNWVLRADYAYKDLGKKSTLQGDGINFDPSWGARTSLKASQFTLGGAFKF